MNKIQDKLRKIYEDEDSKEELLLEQEGVSEQRDRPDVSAAGEEAAVEKYGNVSFADETNKKYPIDKEHIHAAISYFGMPKNYSKYGDADRKKIAGKIAATAKKLGVDLSDDWKKKHGIA